MKMLRTSNTNETFAIERKSLFEILIFDCRDWTYLTISPEKTPNMQSPFTHSHIMPTRILSLSFSLSRKSKYTCFLLRRTVTVAGQGKANMCLCVCVRERERVHAHICQPTNTRVCERMQSNHIELKWKTVFSVCVCLSGLWWPAASSTYTYSVQSCKVWLKWLWHLENRT